MLKDGILIIDFGSQYNQLIARRVRENKVYCQIVPPTISVEKIKEINPKGIILSGGPCSVYHGKAPSCEKELFYLGIPVLGICYGMQLMTKMLGGKVQRTHKREYGRAELKIKDNTSLFKNMPPKITSWMSHGDYVCAIPKGFKTIASTKNTKFASVENKKQKAYGVQFHPEVVHTQKGTKIISNFLFQICKCKRTWTMKSYVKNCVAFLKDKIGKDNVVLGLSGGVDSSVAAVLLHKAIGKQLHCIFVDNGVLRKNERQGVERLFKKNMKMNLTVVDASKQFIKALKGVTEPEKKRKIIGNLFIKVFEKEAKRIGNVKYLAQGTLYPDVIESESAFGGPSAVIKSHHNVGGLPKKMGLKLVEPLRELFKDEVRALGKEMSMSKEVLWRQPFPGPGLAIRVLGEVTEEKLNILKDADDIYISEIKKANLYYTKIWQAFAVILPVKTVGVMGDERTYENVLALRAVTSKDGMTADWAQIPYEILGKISNRIINEVKGVNRVVYDISSKPPGTIEWE